MKFHHTLLFSSLALLAPVASQAESQALESAATSIAISDVQLNINHLDPKSAHLSFDIANNSEHSHALVAAFTPLAQNTHMMHYTDNVHQIMMDSIKLSPHSHFAFKPNDTIIAMHGLKDPVENGGMVPLALIFEDGSTVNLLAQAAVEDGEKKLG